MDPSNNWKRTFFSFITFFSFFSQLFRKFRDHLHGYFPPTISATIYKLKTTSISPRKPKTNIWFSSIFFFLISKNSIYIKRNYEVHKMYIRKHLAHIRIRPKKPWKKQPKIAQPLVYRRTKTLPLYVFLNRELPAIKRSKIYKQIAKIKAPEQRKMIENYFHSTLGNSFPIAAIQTWPILYQWAIKVDLLLPQAIYQNSSKSRTSPNGERVFYDSTNPTTTTNHYQHKQ